MGWRNRISAFVSADVPLSELEPYQRAGADAYGIYEQSALSGWAPLAAWNAFYLQFYADTLAGRCSNGNYVAADTAPFVRSLYEQAIEWVQEARKAQASPAYRLQARDAVPHPLPHWVDRSHNDRQLEAMRSVLEGGRTRVASSFAKFQGDAATREQLAMLLAAIDAEIASIDAMWTRHFTLDLRLQISLALERLLDRVYELGQLLARPELIPRADP